MLNGMVKRGPVCATSILCCTTAADTVLAYSKSIFAVELHVQACILYKHNVCCFGHATANV